MWRKRILIPVMLVSLATVATGPEAASHPVELTVGASQFSTLWQTTPPAFADQSRFVGVGLKMDSDLLAFGVSAAVFSLDVLRFVSGASLDVYTSLTLRAQGKLKWMGIGGLVWMPRYDWVGYYGALEAQQTLAPHVRVFGGMAVETTAGAQITPISRSPSGTLVGFYFGMTFFYVFN